MDELKPCPFCGAEAKMLPHEHNGLRLQGGGIDWCVICQNEDTECNVRLLYCQSKEEAIQQWNRRT